MDGRGCGRGHGWPLVGRGWCGAGAAGRVVGGQGPGGHMSDGHGWPGLRSRPWMAARGAWLVWGGGRREGGGWSGARRPHERRPWMAGVAVAAVDGRSWGVVGVGRGPAGGWWVVRGPAAA